MDDLFLLSEAQMRRVKPHFPQSHGIARMDDHRVVSGIVFIIRCRVALERCAARLRPAQGDLQPPPDLDPKTRLINTDTLGALFRNVTEFQAVRGRLSRKRPSLADIRRHRDWRYRALLDADPKRRSQISFYTSSALEILAAAKSAGATIAQAVALLDEYSRRLPLREGPAITPQD
jgi:transposase